MWLKYLKFKDVGDSINFNIILRIGGLSGYLMNLYLEVLLFLRKFVFCNDL